MEHLVCTILLIGRLCFVQPADEMTLQLSHDVPAATATITAEGWEANVVWASDHQQVLNPTHMSQACDDWRCVAYFQRCADKRCHVVIDTGDGRTLSILITADSGERAVEVLQGLHYLRDRSDVHSAVWLGSLNGETRFKTPFCERAGMREDGRLRWAVGCEFLND